MNGRDETAKCQPWNTPSCSLPHAAVAHLSGVLEFPCDPEVARESGLSPYSSSYDFRDWVIEDCSSPAHLLPRPIVTFSSLIVPWYPLVRIDICSVFAGAFAGAFAFVQYIYSSISLTCILPSSPSFHSPSRSNIKYFVAILFDHTAHTIYVTDTLPF